MALFTKRKIKRKDLSETQLYVAKEIYKSTEDPFEEIYTSSQHITESIKASSREPIDTVIAHNALEFLTLEGLATRIFAHISNNQLLLPLYRASPKMKSFLE